MLDLEKILLALKDRFLIQEFPKPVSDRIIFQLEGQEFFLRLDLADEPLGDDDADDYLDVGDLDQMEK